ncbi:MAG: WYL domain-containing protein [Duncaniella sp.]|nr:WYL domain-containing protein [Duncaniella sp.]
MSRNLLGRYIWLIDTIVRYGSITRERLNELWMRSRFSDGSPLPRRTFYTYRQAIEELFNVTIECNPATYEYSIRGAGAHDGSVTDWMLNSATISDVLSGVRDISSRVFLEDVPSAREHLATVTEALRSNHPLRFTYHPYTRVNPTRGVVIEPYFLKIFRQRWYVTGLNVKDDTIKTYALDRMSDVTLDEGTFTIPADFDAEEFVSEAFGIVFTKGQAHRVAIKADARQAKYLRALPLHPSQSEVIHDRYSIFYYHIKLTPDFVQELLSMGPNIEVVSPPELKAMIVESLRASLALYETAPAGEGKAQGEG